MIIGEYHQKLGEKSRIAFPKKFREELGNKLIITKGYEGCLVIVSPAQWEELVKESVSGPFVSGLIRDTSRFLLASASELDLDNQGRFVLPEFLKIYAQIAKEGVFIGLARWVELWDSEIWSKKVTEIEKNSSEIADKLSRLKLGEN
jgi:MraZ protein